MLNKISMMIVFIIIFSIGFAPSPVHAATFNVCTLGDLTTAITTANGNGQADIINFTCSTTLTFTSAFTITNDGAGNGITINRAGNTVIFDGGGTTRFFTVNTGASLELNGLTLQNGRSTGSGAIYNSGTVTINDSTFTGNSSTFLEGGAIYNYGGTLTITNSTFTGNSTTRGGAIFNEGGTLTISTSTFTGNSATQQGGAIHSNAGTLSISNGTFTNNLATTIGGAISIVSGTTDITNSNFTTNTSLISGAINNAGTLTLSDSTFTGNSGTSSSGGLGNTGTATLINNTFTNNISPTGGAIYNSGVISSQDSYYENNTCVGTITDNGGNTRFDAVTSAGCPGDIILSASAVCVDKDLVVTIISGDPNFQITSSNGTLDTGLGIGTHTINGPVNETGVNVTELAGDTENFPLGDFDCVTGVIIPPVRPPTPAPTPTVTVLGCALDSTDGVEVANAPDNTYCRVLMRNGGVVSYSGAIPAELIGLGVILAVDVYRLEGGMSVNTFPSYARVCLSGSGRLFYLDARQAPRLSVELATEAVDGLTCGWIPAPGTLILTH